MDFTDTGLAEDDLRLGFYSVNNDYYSAGVTAQATTNACGPDARRDSRHDTNDTSFTAS